MKIKDSNIYKNYLVYKSNPQFKTIVSLFFWLLFFFFIILFARGANKKDLNNNQVINDRIKSYEYTYTDGEKIIYGKNYDNKHLFIISNHKYYYNGVNVYEVNDYNLK